MAITNNEAIKFSNEKIRVMADLMSQLYNLCKTANAEWTARNLISVIPNDVNEVMHDSAYGTDGTDGDGRPIVTGADLNGIMSGNVDYFVELLEANTNVNLNNILSVAVNTVNTKG
jgi:hypothetical protein